MPLLHPSQRCSSRIRWIPYAPRPAAGWIRSPAADAAHDRPQPLHRGACASDSGAQGGARRGARHPRGASQPRGGVSCDVDGAARGLVRSRPPSAARHVFDHRLIFAVVSPESTSSLPRRETWKSPQFTHAIAKSATGTAVHGYLLCYFYTLVSCIYCIVCTVYVYPTPTRVGAVAREGAWGVAVGRGSWHDHAANRVTTTYAGTVRETRERGHESSLVRGRLIESLEFEEDTAHRSTHRCQQSGHRRHSTHRQRHRSTDKHKDNTTRVYTLQHSSLDIEHSHRRLTWLVGAGTSHESRQSSSVERTRRRVLGDGLTLYL